LWYSAVKDALSWRRTTMMLACTPGGLHHLHAQQVQTKSAVKVRASGRPNQTLYTMCSCIVQWAMNTLAYRWPDLKNFPKLDDKVGIPWVGSPALQVELRHAMRNSICTPPLLDGLGNSDPVHMGWRLRDRTDGWCII
jgi:hypothetical protein